MPSKNTFKETSPHSNIRRAETHNVKKMLSNPNSSLKKQAPRYHVSHINNAKQKNDLMILEDDSDDQAISQLLETEQL